MPPPAPAPLTYADAVLRDILARVRIIAMVGASPSEMRPSYFAMLYLLGKGYDVIPVNPRHAGKTIQGREVFPDLESIPLVPDMLDIFRRSSEAGPLVDAGIEKGIRIIWMQLGVRDDAAAARAEAAGCTVIMDRCPKIEHARLMGDIGWMGVNRRIVSARKGKAMQLTRRKGGLV